MCPNKFNDCAIFTELNIFSTLSTFNYRLQLRSQQNFLKQVLLVAFQKYQVHVTIFNDQTKPPRSSYDLAPISTQYINNEGTMKLRATTIKTDTSKLSERFLTQKLTLAETFTWTTKNQKTKKKRKTDTHTRTIRTLGSQLTATLKLKDSGVAVRLRRLYCSTFRRRNRRLRFFPKRISPVSPMQITF